MTSNLVQCLGIYCCKVLRDINYKVKDTKLHLAFLTTKKEAQQLVGLVGFRRQHTPHLAVLHQPIYQVAQRAASFLWGPEAGEGSVTGPGYCAGRSAVFSVG